MGQIPPAGLPPATTRKTLRRTRVSPGEALMFYNSPDMVVTSSGSLSIRRISFRNFKGLGDYSVTLEAINVLCGSNNSGKSTILGSLRALAAGIRTASARLPARITGPFGLSHGYWLPAESIPISLENAHTDLSDDPATVTFVLSNDNRLHLWFPIDGGCALLAQLGDTPTSPKDTLTFRRNFDLNLGIVPVLGPVEHDEEQVEERTVERNIATHRASRPGLRLPW